MLQWLLVTASFTHATITKKIPENFSYILRLCYHVKFCDPAPNGVSDPQYQKFWPIALMMAAASTSETSANFCQTSGTTTQKTAVFKMHKFG
jgi:hypothetical protein